ncbi:MAG: methyltransferase dimerization domain-containing protein, partial [Pseudomonadota bacterium]
MSVTDAPHAVPPRHGPTLTLRDRFRAWRNRKVADRAFQSWAAAHPLTRGVTRRDGAQLFDLVAGFVNAQVLYALVELDLLATLMEAPQSLDRLAARHGIAPHRMAALLNAGVALGLLERSRSGYQTARLGAAAVGVPGLPDMIRHHAVFYRDMADPVALLREDADTELARFWPYVFGADGPLPDDVATRYSELMAESQALVAEETLRTVDFSQ